MNCLYSAFGTTKQRQFILPKKTTVVMVACWTSVIFQLQCKAGARIDKIIISMASAKLAKPMARDSRTYNQHFLT